MALEIRAKQMASQSEQWVYLMYQRARVQITLRQRPALYDGTKASHPDWLPHASACRPNSFYLISFQQGFMGLN
jgi:hypothetical protein